MPLLLWTRSLAPSCFGLAATSLYRQSTAYIGRGQVIFPGDKDTASSHPQYPGSTRSRPAFKTLPFAHPR